MVTFWPWKADDTSPASFEKALSTLSAKISKTSSKLDSLRQRSRRLNVLWTLYAGFAYLLCLVILVLVVGWRRWGPAEYTGVAVGPGVIYAVRLALTTYYDYRISSVQAQLEEQEKQRSKTIQKLKAATKYDSTAELLKKYGGTPTPKPKAKENAGPKLPNGKGTPQQRQAGQQMGPRTGIMPPPTANIQGRPQPPSLQGSPQNPLPRQMPSPQSQRPASPQSPGADFAPNAFPAPPQYAQVNEGPRWYDRLMDVLLGEDESLPGKRLVLICKHCRLVNGQAPPGVKRMEDVGKWRCAGCGTMNGEDSEVKKIVESIKNEAPVTKESPIQESPTQESPTPIPKTGEAKGDSEEDEVEDEESDVTQYSSEEEATKPAAEAETPPRRSTRQRGKKRTGSTM